MPAKPVALPSKTFATQGEAKKFFTEMLARYADGEFVNSEDEELLYEFLERHPEAEEKIGTGVKAFFRQKSPEHPTSCFHVLRVDGEKTDFGLSACLTGRAPGLRQAFYEACRRSVVAPLMQQKQALFDAAPSGIRCFRTGELTTILTSEYRHTEPRFRDIVADFIRAYNLTIHPAMVTQSHDLQYQTVFTDPAMARNFVDYHAAVASLEIFKKYVR